MNAEDRGQPSATAWEVVARDAASRVPGDQAAIRVLAQVCLAADEIAPEHSTTARPGGLPQGRPTAALVRATARHLLAAVRDPAGREPRYLRVIGLIFASWKAQPRPASDDASAELRTGLEQRGKAVKLARQLGDDALLAWCLYHRAHSERKLARWEQGMSTLRASADIATRLLDAAADDDVHPGAFTMFASDWADPPDVYHRVVACRALKWLTFTASMLGDMASWEAATREVLALAEPLAEARPSIVVEALSRASILARHVGDRDGFRLVEERLRRWAEESGVNRVKRGWISQAAANAQYLQDYERAHELYREQVDIALEGIEGVDVPAPGSDPDAYLPAAAVLEDRGYKARQISLGNAACDTAANLWRTRQTADDPAAWHQASQWLDLAEHAWRSDGQNGLVAIELTRARLLADHPAGPDPLRAAEIALQASRSALHAGTRANAAEFAAECCAPGDLQVRQQLDELIAEATPVQRAKRLAVRAIWHQKHAEHLEATSRSREAIADAWRNAEEDALAAAHGLEVGGVFLDAGKAADAWSVAALACVKPGSAATDNMPAVRLERLLNVIRCVAELLTTASRPSHQSRLAGRYGAAFTGAAILAAELGDAHAADMIMEAVRRDRVGVLITDLIRRPEVSEKVRIAAERVIAANNADPSPPPAENPEEDRNRERETRALTHITKAITIRRVRSTAQADEILGIVSALADGRSVPHVTAADLLAKRGTTKPGAVLQFCPTGLGILPGTAQSRTLYRRLTWTDSSGRIHEYLDSVPLPFRHDQLDPDTMAYWPHLHTLTGLLLPEPLLDLLGNHDRERPLRLLVIPTGLFDIAFDALPIDQDRHLLDAAEVSVHTSLTTASHLLQRVSLPDDTASIAVYDTRTLSYAADELQVLRDHLPPVQELPGIDEFRVRFSAPHGHDYRVLAMAVHGLDDQDGWGQVKEFPDLTTFTAAEAMALCYPQLCVLASCYSRIRVRDQVELAGFPLSFFARGATTVIGSLLAVNDHATSEIMQRFWINIANEIDPVRALHVAKLDWLAEDPRRRLAGARHWAGLIAFGGAHL